MASGLAELRRLANGVCHVVLTERLNVLSAPLIARLNVLLDEVEGSPEGPLAVVLSSANEKLFSAGLDLKMLMQAPHEERTAFLESFIALVQRIMTLPCPTVCLVKGKCLAGGVFLMMGCDYRIACDDGATYFHLNEVENGLTFTPGLADFVVSRIESPALRLRAGAFALKISPEEALAGGMIQALAPEPDYASALRYTADLAGEWAKKASTSMHRAAMKGIKQAICATALRSKL